MAHTTKIPPSQFCKRLYYDTAVFDASLLSHLVSDMGADHILLGTDHPFELGDADPLATVLFARSRPGTPRRSCGAQRIPCSDHSSAQPAVRSAKHRR